MNNMSTQIKGYALAALIGAVGGGLLVALGIKAVPRMMAGTMQNMMSQMKEKDFDPSEM
jgi:hypothetical protein